MIPPDPSFGGRSSVTDGARSGNPRAGVYRIGSYFSSSRLCSLSVAVRGAKSCWEGGPLQLVLPGGVDLVVHLLLPLVRWLLIEGLLNSPATVRQLGDHCMDQNVIFFLFKGACVRVAM